MVEAAAHGEDAELPRENLVSVLMGLPLPFTLTKTMARKVADLLIDKALLTAFLKIESNSSVPIRDLITRTLDGTQRWLDAVHSIAPVEPGNTPVVVPYVVDPQLPRPLLSLDAHVEMYRTHHDAYLSSPARGSDWLTHRLKVVQEVEWRVHDLESAGVDELTNLQAANLGDIYCDHHMYQDYKRLRQKHRQLPRRARSPGDRDTWIQLASCHRMLWSIRRYQPERSLESRQELTDWVTHVLIKLRGLAEQSVGRFGRRLVCWPNNNFPPENNKIKSDIMTKLLKAKSEEELTATARKCAWCVSSVGVEEWLVC